MSGQMLNRYDKAMRYRGVGVGLLVAGPCYLG
jgi:hypothetical protein